MQLSLYDTYVTKKDERIMHFDVIVEESTPQSKAIEYGKEYLNSADQGEQKITQEECQFCHIQEAPGVVEKDLEKKAITSRKWKVVLNTMWRFV